MFGALVAIFLCRSACEPFSSVVQEGDGETWVSSRGIRIGKYLSGCHDTRLGNHISE